MRNGRGETLVVGMSRRWEDLAVDEVLCEEQDVAHGIAIAAAW